MDKKTLIIWYACVGLYAIFVILTIINQMKEVKARKMLYRKANEFFNESEVIPEKPKRKPPVKKPPLKVEK